MTEQLTLTFWQQLTPYLNGLDFNYLRKESMMITQLLTTTCIYCDRSITDENTGALCAWHLDLEVLADCLQDRGQPVTLAALIALITIGVSRGGSFVITPDDLAGLITPEFARKYKMEAIPFQGEPMAGREATPRDFYGL